MSTTSPPLTASHSQCIQCQGSQYMDSVLELRGRLIFSKFLEMMSCRVA